MNTPTDRPWQSRSVPEAVAGVPAMLSNEERQYLSWVTATRYQGWGAIVDLGPWLGASSVALAEGLRESGKPGRVRSFDRFTWEQGYMGTFACDLKDGDDFQPLFARMTAAYADRVEGTQMDLLAGSWNGGPIEILFVDAAKSWELWRSILRVFGPFLEPGRSLVVQQDFRHPACPWLVLTCDDRPDVWREIDAVDVGSTITFQPLRRIAASDAPALVREDLPYERRRELLTARITRDGAANAWRYQLMLWAEATLHGDAKAEELLPALLAARAQSADAAHNVPLMIDQTRLQQGWQLCHQQRYADAAAIAARIDTGSPVEYEALVLAGHAARSRSELDRAEVALAKAARLAPERSDAVIETMWLRLAQQRFADGERAGASLLAREHMLPDAVRASLHRVRTHLAAYQGRIDDALAANDRALAIVPGHVDILLDRARILAAAGKRAQAETTFGQLRRDHPHRADIETAHREFLASASAR